MASTPSASALAAVLRCRGNIWARNPPNKRPGPAAYSLDVPGGPVRDSPELVNNIVARVALPRGQRVVVGRTLAVGYKSNMCGHTGLHQPGEDALSTGALLRHLALQLTSRPPVSHVIKQTPLGPTRTRVFVQDTHGRTPGSFKVSITSSSSIENSGQVLFFVLAAPFYLYLRSGLERFASEACAGAVMRRRSGSANMPKLQAIRFRQKDKHTHPQTSSVLTRAGEDRPD